ncbi:hypothetical protein ACFQ0D_10785, partial [Micromonospora zhanjiangensis]
MESETRFVFAGLPEPRLDGLGETDARALLAAAVRAPLNDRVRDWIVAEARGNPWRCWSCRLPGRHASRPAPRTRRA